MAIMTVGSIRDAIFTGRPFSDAARFFVRAGAFDRALQLARQIGDRRWELYDISRIGRAQLDSSDAAGARATYREAMKLAEDLGAADQVAEFQATVGDVTAARKTLERLTPGKKRESAIVGVAAACASVGDEESALQLIETITVPEIRSEVWIRAASSLKARRAKPNG
jgi:hypothetical protein